jgi:hypothetical protein
MCSLRGIGKGNEVGAAMVTERTKGGTRADRRSEAIFLERRQRSTVGRVSGRGSVEDIIFEEFPARRRVDRTSSMKAQVNCSPRAMEVEILDVDDSQR